MQGKGDKGREKGKIAGMELGYRSNIAWQKNRDAIVKTVNLIKRLPRTTPFDKMVEQLFSSISSIGANIAEGYSDFEGNEYVRYLKIAIRSAYETDHWLTTLLSVGGLKDKIVLGMISEIIDLNLETIRILSKVKQAIEKRRKGI